MKKITLFFILTFASLTVTTQAQKNRYLKFTNTVNSGGGRFVIPNSPAINVNAKQHKTITFRIMIPTDANNDINYARIMQKNENAVHGNGAYGITFGSIAESNKNDLRVIATSTTTLKYGNLTNLQATTLNDGNWHHFALVLNDDTDPVGNAAQKSKLYIDGKLFITVSRPENTQTEPIDFTNTSNLVFGATATEGTVVKGMAIDDIRIWDYAFTPAEVDSDRTAKVNVSTASLLLGLLAAYDFEAATPGSTPDITGKTTTKVATILAPRGAGNTITLETGPSTVIK